MRSKASCRSNRQRTSSLLIGSVMWALLLIPVLAASSPVPAHGQALAPFASGRPFSAPFSFRYGGKSSAKLGPKWRAQQQMAEGTPGVTRTIYTDPRGKLEVSADVRRFPDFPDAVDYLVHFRNIGSEDTDILEDILPLDTTTQARPGVVIVHHARGSDATAHDFEPLEERFAAGGSAHLASHDGRSSSGASLPFFNVENAGQGIVAAVGWSGNWKADFAEADDGLTLHTTAGMPRTHLRLHPGEEIRTPRIVLLRWSGGDWQDAQNTWRRLLLRHYTPQENGEPLRGPITVGDGGSVPVATHLAAVDWIQRHAIRASMYSVDSGWYGASLAGDDTLEHSWWGNRGNWSPSATYYPGGLQPLGASAKAAGLDFSLWIEPETAMPDSQLVRDHPGWFLRTDPSHAAAMLLDLGNPAARTYMTGLLSGFINGFGMTWVRIDSNTAPADFWRLADPPDRVGMTEIQHIEGLYAMLDDLRAQHPGLKIDNCASGGRRFDVEMMSRSFAVWRTDHGYSDTEAVQAQTQALAPWVPETSGTEAYALSAPWLRPGPYSTARSRYLLRLAYSTGLTLGTGAGTVNPAWTAQVQEEIAEYREVQPYLYGDFYALQPYTLDPGAWTAWQWDRPEQKDGIAIVLRRPKSMAGSLPLHLQHMEQNAAYMVEVRRTYASTSAQQMTGRSLAQLTVELPDAPDSAIVLYRKLD